MSLKLRGWSLRLWIFAIESEPNSGALFYLCLPFGLAMKFCSCIGVACDMCVNTIHDIVGLLLSSRICIMLLLLRLYSHVMYGVE